MVTLEFLLEGAAYSLQNSGILIQDAANFCSQKSFTSAVVLAMFGREELGKHKMLRAFYERVAKGEVVTCQGIEKAMCDHSTKQELGMLSLTVQPEKDDPLHQAMKDEFAYHPQSEEYKKAEEVFERRTKEFAEELPGKRHRLRMDLLYVDVRPGCRSWKRPSDRLSEDEARREVMHAVSDFNTKVSNFVERKDCYEAFLMAFQNWKELPDIPFVHH
ncbi:MAG: AbiV family abortive infection protein [Gemmataceae bacterium]